MKKDLFFQKYGYILIFLLALLFFLIYPNVGIYDWDKEILYISYIKTSFQEFKQFPLFLWNSYQLSGYPAVDQSAFFAANPETMLFSPFIPLLLFLSPVIFLKLLVFLNGILGIVGLLLLAKKLSWQPSQTRIFSALFLLSPIIFQHVAIGYLPWINLFLFPWLLYFLLSDDFISRSLGSGMVLAVVLLQGGLHIFIWMAFFLALFELCTAILRKRYEHLISFLLIIVVAIFLALPRFYLSLQSFASFSQKFFSGYSLRAFLKWGLVPPFFTPASMDDIEFFIEGYIDGVPYWDGELFWGALILLVVLLPVYFLYKHKQEKQFRKKDSLTVAGTSFILWMLSLGNIYEKIITFFSGLLHLPALEGMEKYPFRLAILAYFGFAFVIAESWSDLPDFFIKVVAELKHRFERISILFMQFCGWLKKHNPLFRWQAGILLGLSMLASILKPIILSWLQAQIGLAYNGDGIVWLAERMERAASIPLEKYLTKASTFYGYVQHFLIGLAVLFSILWFLGIIKMHGYVEKKTERVQAHFPLWIIEVLLVVPLLLAFGMWWRVALATPQNTLPVWQTKAPEIIKVSEADSSEVSLLSYSPLSLHLKVNGIQDDTIFVVNNVPAADARFLKVQSANAEFTNWNDKLGIQINRNGDLIVSVDKNYILVPSAFAFCAWLVCGGILFRKKDQK